ncbi:MAG: hypothetical protein LBS23_03025 [Holosporaceae bacterium]|jgi:hypothetical protein|nr:hypothetical protein [Holosporaceae bacterium]
MNNNIAMINRQGMILSNFLRIRYGCNKQNLTLGDIMEICEFLNNLKERGGKDENKF